MVRKRAADFKNFMDSTVDESKLPNDELTKSLLTV